MRRPLLMLLLSAPLLGCPVRDQDDDSSASDDTTVATTTTDTEATGASTS